MSLIWAVSGAQTLFLPTEMAKIFWFWVKESSKNSSKKWFEACPRCDGTGTDTAHDSVISFRTRDFSIVIPSGYLT